MARFCVETLQHTLPLLSTGESLLSLYSESLQMFLVLFLSYSGKVRVLKLQLQICSNASIIHPALLCLLVDVSEKMKVFQKALELLSDILALLRVIVSPHELWEECSISANELASVSNLFISQKRVIDNVNVSRLPK